MRINQDGNDGFVRGELIRGWNKLRNVSQPLIRICPRGRLDLSSEVTTDLVGFFISASLSLSFSLTHSFLCSSSTSAVRCWCAPCFRSYFVVSIFISAGGRRAYGPIHLKSQPHQQFPADSSAVVISRELSSNWRSLVRSFARPNNFYNDAKRTRKRRISHIKTTNIGTTTHPLLYRIYLFNSRVSIMIHMVYCTHSETLYWCFTFHFHVFISTRFTIE